MTNGKALTLTRPQRNDMDTYTVSFTNGETTTYRAATEQDVKDAHFYSGDRRQIASIMSSRTRDLIGTLAHPRFYRRGL